VRRSLVTLVTSIVAAAMLAACGSSSPAGGAPPRSATLVLDFTPNPVHVGIYTALARHFDTAAGVRLHVIAPSASTDAIRLLATGRADFAILDIHDLALARQRGADVAGILPIVERPLASVIAAPAVSSPRALVGRTVGVTGAPSDTAVLDSIVAGSGGRPRGLKTITIGFNAVSDLLAGKVAAATAFWNDEGVTLSRQRPGFHVFRVENYGAPSYPELVVCASAKRLRSDPSLAGGVVKALVRGYNLALANPAAGQRALESQVPGLNHALDTAELMGLASAFRGPEGRFGVLDMALLRRWARWEARFGIVKQPPDVSATFDPVFAPTAREDS
jgi:putative hydroxymethylpyrimidine transport system substrate-binding protein